MIMALRETAPRPSHLRQFLLWPTGGAPRRRRVAAKGTTLEGLGEEVALVTCKRADILAW